MFYFAFVFLKTIIYCAVCHAFELSFIIFNLKELTKRLNSQTGFARIKLCACFVA